MSQPNSQEMHTGSGLRLDIQGLRALAVLAVILFHINAEWLPGGFTGVDVFFVISGFIVSRVILQMGEGFSWKDFFVGRIRRIVPAYAVMLAGVALVGGLLLTPNDFTLFEKSLTSALAFVSNQHFANAGGYFSPAVHEWPLLHTWSLAIEMQFYVLLPFLLRAVPGHFLPAVIGALCLTGFGFTQWQLVDASATQAADYAMSARAPEFLMGAWLAAVLAKGASVPTNMQPFMAWLGLGLMLSAFVLLDGSRFSPVWAAWPCAGALLVIAAGGSTGIGRCLSTQSAVMIGALSYSLYLWHWPVLALMRYVWQLHDLPWLATVASVALFSGLAWLSWRLVEQPWLRPKASWPMGKMTFPTFLLTIVASLTVAHQVNASLVAAPQPAAALRYAPADSICHGHWVGTCERGASDVPVSMLVMGDSHAAQLNLFMDHFGQAHRVRATVLSASSCFPMPNFNDPRLANWAVEPCRFMQDAVRGNQQDMKTLMVAGKWSYQLDNPAFAPLFQQFMRESSMRQQRVVVMAQLPMLTHDPVRSLRLNSLGIQLPSTRDPKVDAANAKLRELVGTFSNALFVDFSADPLFQQAPMHKGDIIYMDKHHLNEVGAVRYAEHVGARLAGLLAPGTARP